jgi:1,4-alpha-glucan branching enzyme
MSKKQETKSASQAPRSHCACVGFINPKAMEVCIAGSFNDWHPAATLMISLGDGKWAKELALPPGRYEYRFVVDGQWVDDPAAKETVPNPFGGFNAVLVVGPNAAATEKKCENEE